MKRLNFPFTAIIGQDKMKKALVLNVIDPQIGGVLLTGRQGTGKSTAVRALAEILPDIEYIQNCPFSCNPKADPEYLCDSCRELLKSSGTFTTDKKSIPLVDLPLGVTEDMVCGSLDLEKVLKEGIKSLHPGLLAKANRGILYIDEINLLQDHIVDILLDSAASGVNIIEREGVSISHPARFILVGSMNPEEGELRPQINDRLGLEVSIEAPVDPVIRAEITKRVMEFNDNPNAFIEKYKEKQCDLKTKILAAKKIIKDVVVPAKIYEFVANLVSQLGIHSQRADITLIRCARASAAFRGSKLVELIDIDGSIDLVFEHRLKSLHDDIEPQELKDKIYEIFGKIKEANESTTAYKPNKDQDGPLKSSQDPQSEFKRQPYDSNLNPDLPENNQKVPDNPDMKNWDRDQTEGIKVLDDYEGNKFTAADLKPIADRFTKRITDVLTALRTTKQKVDFAGRGSRTKITSTQKGCYITYKFPVSFPKNIAFDASLKRYLVHNICDSTPLESYNFNPNPINLPSSGIISQNTLNASVIPLVQPVANRTEILIGNAYNKNLSFPICMDQKDIMEKVFEFKAPLSMYFILDASGSMSRYIKQMADIIKSLHTEGYKKKDKTSILVFKGKRVHVLQRPTTNVSRVIAKLPSIEGTSYTPLASALVKVESMIKAERTKSKDTIPVIVICSDLGANISIKYPELKAQTQEDFNLVADEIKYIAKRLGAQKIKILAMIPKKGQSIKFIGVNPMAIEHIKDDLKRYAHAEIFEFDGYNPKQTLIRLKKIF